MNFWSEIVKEVSTVLVEVLVRIAEEMENNDWTKYIPLHTLSSINTKIIFMYTSLSSIIFKQQKTHME